MLPPKAPSPLLIGPEGQYPPLIGWPVSAALTAALGNLTLEAHGAGVRPSAHVSPRYRERERERGERSVPRPGHHQGVCSQQLAAEFLHRLQTEQNRDPFIFQSSGSTSKITSVVGSVFVAIWDDVYTFLTLNILCKLSIFFLE